MVARVEKKGGTGEKSAGTIASLGIQVSTTRSYFLNKHARERVATGRPVPFGNGVYFEDSYKCAVANCVRLRVKVGIVVGLFVCLR